MQRGIDIKCVYNDIWNSVGINGVATEKQRSKYPRSLAQHVRPFSVLLDIFCSLGSTHHASQL